MAFKTEGYKTKYIMDYGQEYKEYMIYCAVESVSDICVYKMFNMNNEECDICISCEDDTEHKGNRSLIDCLYCLKYGVKDSGLSSWQDIVVEEMTEEEMKNIFGR